MEPSTVIADRVLGKPYLEIDLDREALARFGLNIRSVQDVIDWCIQVHPPLARWETSLATALNEVYVTRDHAVRHGDTLALIPPVSGG